MMDDDIGTDQQLPDALDAVSSTREEAWVTLHECEQYLSPREIADEVGASMATAYRIINEMDDLGLVDTQYVIASDGPTQEFLFINPGEQP